MVYSGGMKSSTIRRYWKETKRPIYSAALVLPFFLIYHSGTFLLRTTYINGADALIIRILSAFSVQSMFASALLLLTCFLVWQWRTRGGWQIDLLKLLLMFGESLLFAGLLFFFSGWLSVYLNRAVFIETLSRDATTANAYGRLGLLVLYCGAGVYEELLFRAILLGLLSLIFSRVLQMKPVPAAAWAMTTASALFSLFHYIGPAGDPFSISSFLQRTFGGLYFSALFLWRGFGVTAACHALYDIFVGLLVN
jgi:membrane protease YdiL (CAAX protease family)